MHCRPSHPGFFSALKGGEEFFRALSILLFAVLTACGGNHRAPGGGMGGLAAVPPQQISAAFVPGGPQDVITVTVRDWRPLRSAVLVSPAGERVPAYSLDVEPAPAEAPPLGAGPVSPALGLPRSVARSDLDLSVALIRLPDPVAYAKSWRDWHIEVAIGDGDNRHEMTLPAPKSPPV
jgi:hypothetical protein